MAEEILQGIGKGNKESAIDRLSHCASKAWALSDVNFGDLTFSGKDGIVFLLMDLAKELDEIQEELWEKIKKQPQN